MGGNNVENQNELSSYNNDDEDLPIIIPTTSTTVANNTTAPITTTSRRSSTSDPTSDFFFELIINDDDDLTTTAAAADDIILHGRLLPFAPPPPLRSLSLSSVAARFTRSRPQLTESSSESSSLPAFRPSRSLDYRKLHRSSHPRHYSKPKPKPKPLVKVPAKLPWYWLGFGLPVKIAAEMELKDIKHRQFHREFVPPAARDFSGGRNCLSASWKFLSVLSCRSHTSVDVSNTAPLHNCLM